MNRRWRSTGARRRPAAAVALVVALALGACSGAQDPGLDPGAGNGPSETSNTLGQCPRNGPDATTPPAGCLDQSGQVLRP